MREIRITIRCTKEPQQHAKILRVKARLGKRKAQELADLLDGTSLSYIHPPGEKSPIGRCCVCMAEVTAEVSEVMDGKEVLPTCNETMDEFKGRMDKEQRKLNKQLKDSIDATKS